MNITRHFTRLSIAGALVAVSMLSATARATEDLPNFHQVGPGIYRGAAPTTAGLTKLKAMGIRTVVDLRIAPKTVKKEKAIAQGMGFNFINLPMGSEPPTQKQVNTLLATLKKAPGEPVFVHCQHGADRTGCMIGIYRETQQGWQWAPTFKEMRKYGFNPRWTKLSAATKERVGKQN